MGQNVEIIKYRRSRAHCGTPTLAGNALSFSDASNADCVKYATPVTVAIQGPADTTITAVSAGEYTNLPNGRVLVTMDPTTSVNVTFGTGTTPVATASCDSFTGGFDTATCGTEAGCAPLGACKCQEEIPAVDAYDEAATITGDGGACGSYGAAGAIDYCDVSYPGGYNSLTMSGGYCTLTDRVYAPAAGEQWGAQMTFANAGLVAAPKVCMDASSYSGVRVCVQGEIKNAFPKTRYVEQGLYDITDDTRNPTEVQNMAWVYLVTDYTSKTSAYTAGHCTSEGCAHPFFAMRVSPDAENCADIAWSDFEFPYWWGDANVGFILPDVCAPGGAVAPAGICTEGEDFDPGTEEPLAHWHACSAMLDKFQYILIAAVDDIGSDPVETVGFRASVSFF